MKLKNERGAESVLCGNLKRILQELDIIYKIPHCVPISAHHKWNFDDLLEKMWDYLNLIRVYTKPKGQLPDYNTPIVLPADSRTVDDLCLKIHKNLQKDFKFAYVWGSSAKHNPQRVGKEHILNDEDVAQIVKKYTKPKGQLPDYNTPIVLPADSRTVDDLCLKIHKNLQKDFKL
ncbi:unnamed protein product [Gongylonema pulchrum]|uniref:TGS domain-containing protein n=1 Tax=Gongylonema pulchrum TaxID=637853 RepID=A0A183DU94_9BILA|nr:unnamed protein product [Gongylonema pulchrum]